MTLLTKRTIGVSSISPLASPASSFSSSTVWISRFSRPSSNSSKPIRGTSCESTNLLIASLSSRSSTSTASVLIPVWNLISSKARRLVGSETAIKRRLPRRYRGSVWWCCISLRSTRSFGIISILNEDRSNKGAPNSSEAASAMAWLSAICCSTR